MMKVSKLSNQNYLREKINISVSTQIIKELMKHIYLNSLFILVVPKCIKIFDKISGGPK
jgi:hypothetical protein